MAIGRLLVKIGSKFGYGGSKLRKTELGYVGDVCPTCSQIRPQQVFSLETKPGRLKDWEELGKYNQCTICCERFNHEPTRYSETVDEDPWAEADELFDLTASDGLKNAFEQDEGSLDSDEPKSGDLCQAFAGNIVEHLKDSKRVAKAGRGGLWGFFVIAAIVGVAAVATGVSPVSGVGALIAVSAMSFLVWSFGNWRRVRAEVLPRVEHFVDTTPSDARDVRNALEDIDGSWRIRHFMDWEMGGASPGTRLPWRLATGLLIGGTVLAFLGNSLQAEGSWLYARIADSPESYEWFAEHYPDNPRSARAKKLAVQRSWQRVKRKDTAESYREFAENHPSHEKASTARQRARNRAFEKAKKSATSAAWVNLLETHPEHPKSAEAAERARTLLLQEAREEENPDKLRTYLNRWPEADGASTVRAELEQMDYEKAADQQGLSALMKYLEAHPQGKHVDEVSAKLQKKLDVENTTADTGPLGKNLVKAVVQNCLAGRGTDVSVRVKTDKSNVEETMSGRANVMIHDPMPSVRAAGERVFTNKVTQLVGNFLDQKCGEDTCNVRKASSDEDALLNVEVSYLVQGGFGRPEHRDQATKKYLALGLVYKVGLSGEETPFHDWNRVEPPETIEVQHEKTKHDKVHESIFNPGRSELAGRFYDKMLDHLKQGFTKKVRAMLHGSKGSEQSPAGS